MKFRNLLLASTIALGIDISSTTSIVNADTWHKGTPLAIRGRYKAHILTDGKGGYSYYDIQKNKINLYSHVVSTTTYTYLAERNRNISYKKIGKNKYELKFDIAKGQGNVEEKNLTQKIAKYGNYIKIDLGKYKKF